MVKLAASGKGHAIVPNDGSSLPEGFDPKACKSLGVGPVSSLVAQTGGELRIDRGDDNDGTRLSVPFA